jgi:anti-anti-sigma regulatory factor
VRIIQKGETLDVTGVQHLGAANASGFESALRAALQACPKRIDIDLSQTGFVDCGGVGALVAVRNCARRRNACATIRLLNPALSAQRLLKLTGTDALFSIEGRY